MKIKEILGTGHMDKSFKNEKDFFAKYFTRPFLTRKARKDRPIRVKVNSKGLPENFADGKKKGKSRPGRVKRSGASCNGSVSELRAKAKKASGEKAKMYHWCANMKSGRSKSK